MPRATQSNSAILNIIQGCYITIPGGAAGGGEVTINFDYLPEISDSKGSKYNEDPVPGRSSSLANWAYSEDRTISIQLHFYVIDQSDIDTNLKSLRAIESAVYPRDGQGGVSFRPPPVCQIKCGKLLGNDPLCVYLVNYSVKFPTDVAWDEKTLLPYKFDVDTTWRVTYKSSDLPGQDKIVQ